MIHKAKGRRACVHEETRLWGDYVKILKWIYKFDWYQLEMSSPYYRHEPTESSDVFELLELPKLHELPELPELKRINRRKFTAYIKACYFPSLNKRLFQNKRLF